MRLKALWSDYSPYSKFVILVGVVLVTFGVVILPAFMLLKPLFGIDLVADPSALTDYSSQATVQALRFIQVIQSISVFIIPAFIMAYMVDSSAPRYLAIDRTPRFISVMLATAAILVAIPVINWMVALNEGLKLPPGLSEMEAWMKQSEETAAKITEAFLQMNTPVDLVLTILLMALLPAVGEELLFRGVIQRLFTGWTKNIHVSIVLTAILFSAIHMQFYGFLPRMMLGIYLGYLLVWSRSLWLPVIAHFVNNAAAVIFHYLNRNSDMKIDSDGIGTRASDTLIVLSGLAMLSMLSYFIYRQERKSGAIY